MTDPRTHRARGQAMVEFALILPLLAVMMVGALDLTRITYETMIVRESAEEAGKMAMIDRVHGSDTTGRPMSNQELLRWVRDAAHEMNSSIQPDSIQVPQQNYPWLFQADTAANSANDGKQMGQPIFKFFDNMNLYHASFLVDTLGCPEGSAKTPDPTIAALLDPGLETMRLDYHPDVGLSGGSPLSIRINYSFSQYSMFTLPLSFPQAGCMK